MNINKLVKKEPVIQIKKRLGDVEKKGLGENRKQKTLLHYFTLCGLCVFLCALAVKKKESVIQIKKKDLGTWRKRDLGKTGNKRHSFTISPSAAFAFSFAPLRLKKKNP
ncbi:hypothetical protein ACKGJN_10400 [Gillisia sp. Q332]|uniref:hypothetical protein n=1 Tax=Gillisia xinjiangensis TaxID=3384765 RepID=UPI00391A1E5D